MDVEGTKERKKGISIQCRGNRKKSGFSLSCGSCQKVLITAPLRQVRDELC